MIIHDRGADGEEHLDPQWLCSVEQPVSSPYHVMEGLAQTGDILTALRNEGFLCVYGNILICVHRSPLFWISFLFRSTQSTEESSPS